jgi:hypothetical protein
VIAAATREWVEKGGSSLVLRDMKVVIYVVRAWNEGGSGAAPPTVGDAALSKYLSID